MSIAPRPQISARPSESRISSPPNGSLLQPSGLTGTTSVCPIRHSDGASGSDPSMRATIEPRPGSDSYFWVSSPAPSRNVWSRSELRVSSPDSGVPSLTQALRIIACRSSVVSPGQRWIGHGGHPTRRDHFGSPRRATREGSRCTFGGMADRAEIGMCFDRTFPAGAMPEYARRVEAAGIEQLWVIEDCFYTAGVSLAATALAVTDSLKVGIGIMPAVARNPAITAMEIATLCNIAPGRFIPGIGHGLQNWMQQMGARTPSPLTTLDETITVVKRLLAGDEVTFSGREVTLDAVQLDQPPSVVPPVIAGVQQHKSMAVAGRVADGVLLVEGAGPAYVNWALDHAGRPDDFHVATFTMMAVADTRREAYGFVAPVGRRDWSPSAPGVQGAAVLRRDGRASRRRRFRRSARHARRLLGRDRCDRNLRRRPRPCGGARSGRRQQHQHLSPPTTSRSPGSRCKVSPPSLPADPGQDRGVTRYDAIWHHSTATSTGSSWRCSTSRPQ